MTAEQLVVLALLVAAFVAGWVARGGRDDEPEEAGSAGSKGSASGGPTAAVSDGPKGVASGASKGAAPGGGRPDPAGDAERAISLASAALDTAVDRWLDERDEITPAGRAAVGEVERAVQRLDVAAARLDEVDETLGDAAYDALDALRTGARLLASFRDGHALDVAASRELERVEDEVARARAAFASGPS
ncbi:MAG: hypothetical protein M3389_06020 [Actinomycetota bacterium]|nr:hypothetical protein [Actinomycetota bacterium]